jgi:hypothetical protein
MSAVHGFLNMNVDVDEKVTDQCASPLCRNVVEPGRDDKRYCGPECRQAMSLIKRTGALYGLSAETVHQALEVIREIRRARVDA